MNWNSKTQISKMELVTSSTYLDIPTGSWLWSLAYQAWNIPNQQVWEGNASMDGTRSSSKWVCWWEVYSCILFC